MISGYEHDLYARVRLARSARRGLKQTGRRGIRAADGSPRAQREAWIATVSPDLVLLITLRSPRAQREAWIETITGVPFFLPISSSPRAQREAWIETMC